MSISNIHRNTGRRSYPSAANDIGFLLDQLCRLIWSMLDCISHSIGVPGGAVTPDGDQSVGHTEASFTATHFQSNLYATCLAWVHDSVQACHHLLPLVDSPKIPTPVATSRTRCVKCRRLSPSCHGIGLSC